MKKKLEKNLKDEKNMNNSSNKNPELSCFSSVVVPSNIEENSRNLLVEMMPKEKNEFAINEINKQLLKKLKEKD